MPARLQFELSMGKRPVDTPTRRRRESDQMRLLVLADLGGARTERPPLASRATWRVDVDNLDATLARAAPAVAVDAGGQRCEFAPRAIDDFHPDRLLQTLPPLKAAWEARQRLADPAQFGRAASDLLGGLLGGAGTPRPAAAAAPRSADGPAAAIDALIRDLVAPHVRPDAPPQQAAMVAAADDALARLLREVLHAPAFQALEAAWRGVEGLVSRLELDESLQVHLYDVTREELLADIVAAQGRIERSGAYAALVDRWRNQPGGQGWTALIGLWRFGPADADIGLLAALGILASQAGGPFIGGGDLALAGTDAAALAGWHDLRRSEVAPWIALVAPRLLLRVPYGRQGDRVETFAFEELPAGATHEQYLWAPGALAAAQLLGHAFAVNSWAFTPSDERDLNDLPSCTRPDAHGEPELVPNAEHFLGEREAEGLLAAGLMPLLSHRHRNAVTLPRWQSIAEPPTALAALPA